MGERHFAVMSGVDFYRTGGIMKVMGNWNSGGYGERVGSFLVDVRESIWKSRDTFRVRV
jgi:hypothetical protein